MEKNDKALELFNSNLSCAQSVLITMASEVGIDETLSFRIGAGLGGGVGRTQNLCGAINAGAVILGLKYGNYSAEDVESKNRLADIVGQFVNECTQSLGATQCLDLIKVDLNNKAQKDFANKTGHLAQVCNNAVGETVKILEKYMNQGL
jgi:C_GCAxxG_C_C family probable redox protein